MESDDLDFSLPEISDAHILVVNQLYNYIKSFRRDHSVQRYTEGRRDFLHFIRTCYPYPEDLPQRQPSRSARSISRGRQPLPAEEAGSLPYFVEDWPVSFSQFKTDFDKYHNLIDPVIPPEFIAKRVLRSAEAEVASSSTAQTGASSSAAIASSSQDKALDQVEPGATSTGLLRTLDQDTDTMAASNITFTKEQFAQFMAQFRQPQPQPAVLAERRDHIKAQNIGYFDPDNEAPHAETTDGKTIYHNVFAFTERLRAKSTAYHDLSKHVDECLRGKADRWFTVEISNTTRAGLMTNIDLWCESLEKRFAEASNVSLQKLEKLRYTIADVRSRKDPEEYIQQAITLGKAARSATTEQSQVHTAYNHLAPELMRDLGPCQDDWTVETFMAKVASYKPIWFDLYKPLQPQSNKYAGKYSKGYQKPYSPSTSNTNTNTRDKDSRNLPVRQRQQDQSDKVIKQESRSEERWVSNKRSNAAAPKGPKTKSSSSKPASKGASKARRTYTSTMPTRKAPAVKSRKITTQRTTKVHRSMMTRSSMPTKTVSKKSRMYREPTSSLSTSDHPRLNSVIKNLVSAASVKRHLPPAMRSTAIWVHA